MVPFITNIFVKNYGTVFENYFRNEKTDRYIFMCYIDAHEKQHPSSVEDSRSVGCNVLSSSATSVALVSLSEKFLFH